MHKRPLFMAFMGCLKKAFLINQQVFDQGHSVKIFTECFTGQKLFLTFDTTIAFTRLSQTFFDTIIDFCCKSEDFCMLLKIL